MALNSVNSRMGSYRFNLVVVLFWCATMTWLVVAKVIPPLRVGEPPTYLSILKESQDDPPVCWTIRLRDRTIGWAANRIVRRNEGMTDLFSRVYLGELPLEELAPHGLAAALKPLLDSLSELDLDKKTRLVIDPLGRLVEFDSRMRLGALPDAIKVQGQIEGATLKLSIQSGDFPIKTERHLPPNGLMSDELSPQARMPHLRVGQKWTVPLYSPFRAPSSPLEILQASVDREDRLRWGGRSVACRVIEYRSDPGSSTSSSERRARAWVDEQGVVLRQEISILRSHLHFIRLPAACAETICRALGDDWSGDLPSDVARQLLRDTADSSP
jgi:hypothetical protein